MLRMLDTVLERGPAARKITAITLSDVLNAMLSRATVSDADLKTTCTTCTSPACPCRATRLGRPRD